MMKKKNSFALLLLLLLFPLQIEAQTAIIAHRGYWTGRGSAQNSIEATKRAYSMRGVYGVEIDVQLTQDSIVILSHDAEISGYRIDKTDWAVLKNNVQLRSKERISTLDEYLTVLEQTPDLKLFLEVKPQANEQANSYIAREAVKAVKKQNLEDRVAYISFGLDICKEISKMAPKALVMYLGSNHSPKELHRMGFKGVNYNFGMYRKNPEWLTEARELGMKIGAWTVNEPSVMRSFILPENFDFMTTDMIESALDVFDILGTTPKDNHSPLYQQ